MKRVSSGYASVPIYVDWSHVIDLTKCPHILVGGSTGSGKSYLMKSMLCDVLESDECRVLVVDPKSVDYRFLLSGMRSWEGRRSEDEDERIKYLWSMRGMRLLVRDDIDSMEVSRVLKSLCDEMDTRYRFMMRKGYVDWKEYLEEPKRKYGDERLESRGLSEESREGDDIGKWKLKEEYNSIWGDKRIVLFIDELADLMYWDRSKTCEVLLGYERDGRDGRDGREGRGLSEGREGRGLSEGRDGVDSNRDRGYEEIDERMKKIEFRMDDREWRLLKGSVEKYLMRLSMLGRASRYPFSFGYSET